MIANPILDWMIRREIPLTVQNYLGFNYCGDVESLDDLGPEDRSEVERLIEDGLLTR